MDTTLLLFGVAFLVIVYLIFKFIKKLVMAVFTLIGVVVLIIAGIFGLVYMDYNYLTSQNDFQVNILYSDGTNYLLGTNMDIKNRTLDVNSVSGISKKELSEIKPEDIDSSDKEFIVVVNDELFKKLLTKDEYLIEGLNDTEFKDYDLSLSKFDILDIIEAEDGMDKFVSIMMKKNKITGLEADRLKPILVNMINENLKENNLTLKQALFLLVISQSTEDEKNYLTLVEGFKDETLQVYPERFSFKLVRLLPVDTIKGFLPDFAKN